MSSSFIGFKAKVDADQKLIIEDLKLLEMRLDS